jgi:hypothetical protein
MPRVIARLAGEPVDHVGADRGERPQHGHDISQWHLAHYRHELLQRRRLVVAKDQVVERDGHHRHRHLLRFLLGQHMAMMNGARPGAERANRRFGSLPHHGPLSRPAASMVLS